MNDSIHWYDMASLGHNELMRLFLGIVMQISMG